MFVVTQRDGAARVGCWRIQKKENGAYELKTPTMLFACSERRAAPPSAEALLADENFVPNREEPRPLIVTRQRAFVSEKRKRNEKKGDFFIRENFGFPLSCDAAIHECAERHSAQNADAAEGFIIHGKTERIPDAVAGTDYKLYTLAGCASLIDNPKELIERIVTARTAIGYQHLLYLPGLGMPHHLAVLTYLGVDVFDSLPLITNARDGYFLDVSVPDGKVAADRVQERFCTCAACAPHDGSALNKKERYEALLHHNYNAALSELRLVRHAICQGSLRELVEQRVRAESAMTALLRLADFACYDFYEERMPLYRERKLLATSFESLWRPEVERFRRRVRERYVTPARYKILLLLPCSARKPYSFSQSHRLFRDAVMSCANPSVIHEVIVTSPLGLVPRELELMYPAQHYDVPVIGRYDREEIFMIQECLRALLRKNKYERAIVHLSAESEYVEDVLAEFNLSYVKTCETRHQTPTSQESLTLLRETLDRESAGYTGTREENQCGDMRSLARVQFGAAGDALLDGCTTAGRYPNLKIIEQKTGKQRGMLVTPRGMISLTLEGAAILAREKTYCVDAHDFLIHGDVFAMGVKYADPEIRIGDEVAVVQNGALSAVGVALMNGAEMTESTKGKAVKIRHYQKDSEESDTNLEI